MHMYFESEGLEACEVTVCVGLATGPFPDAVGQCVFLPGPEGSAREVSQRSAREVDQRGQPERSAREVSQRSKVR